MLSGRCYNCGVKRGFWHILLRGGFCSACRKIAAKSLKDVRQLVETLNERGGEFNPRFYYKLEACSSNRIVLIGEGKPPASPNFGIRFPYRCLNCLERIDPIVNPYIVYKVYQRRTRPFFATANYHDAELIGNFRVEVPICETCQEREGVSKVSSNHRRVREREDISLISAGGGEIFAWFMIYSNFPGQPEFYEVTFDFNNPNYCTLLKTVNRTKVLDQEIHVDIYSRIKTVTFGDFNDDASWSTIWHNPPTEAFTEELPHLKTILIDAETYDFDQLERFLTYAVNHIGQKYLKKKVTAYIYSDPESLHPNIRNSLENLCKKVRLVSEPKAIE